MTTKSVTVTPTKMRTAAPNPEKMTMASIVGEIIHNSIESNRKKELYTEILSRPIGFDNVHDWILAFKIPPSSSNPLASKITSMVEFIQYLCYDKAILTNICQSDNLPKKIVEAACRKSKNLDIF